ncbi:MAG: SDR family NAD(P)-dependent oxidoreductase [Acidobacteria bacterium]|nr:SDR family NAD(P)-dependent oxidoreductase [Acidobacteriota bacterium]
MTNLYSESLADGVAIVTAGSRGIGLATAMALREAGADVLVCGRSKAALDRAGANIVHTPGAGRVATVVADIRRHDEAERVVTAAVDDPGAVDILVFPFPRPRFHLSESRSRGHPIVFSEREPRPRGRPTGPRGVRHREDCRRPPRCNVTPVCNATRCLTPLAS